MKAIPAIPRLLTVSGLMVVAAGCGPGGYGLARPAPASLPPASPLRTASLALPDAWLRHHLMFDEPGSALAMLSDDRGSPVPDDLLRSLQHALVLRASGDFTRSNDLLEWAEQELERRDVRSVSRSVGSFVINDRVLSYRPTPGERGMIPYYRMMNYLALDDIDGAAVEARRLTAFLREDRGGLHRCRSDAMLQYTAGLVFEAADEPNDALVSFRRAEEDFRSCGPGNGGDGGDGEEGDDDEEDDDGGDTAWRDGLAVPDGLARDLYRLAVRLGVDEVADSALARYPSTQAPPGGGTGEVVLLIERGFVTHLAEEVARVGIFDEEIDDIESDDASEIAALSALIAGRLSNDRAGRRAGGSARGDRSRAASSTARVTHVLRLAWPIARSVPRSASQLQVLVGEDTIALARVGDVSAVIEHDLNERRSGMLVRAATRAVTRFLVAREVEKKAEDEGGEWAGVVAGLVVNRAINELERADTRSLSLLPHEISMARLTLPEGKHHIRVETVSPAGEPLGMIDLGFVDVRTGRPTVLNRRIFEE